jgi:transposase InsO family protein
VQFLEEEGIIVQYTMPGTPQQNGVAEKINRTIMDMVILSYFYFYGVKP